MRSHRFLWRCLFQDPPLRGAAAMSRANLRIGLGSRKWVPACLISLSRCKTRWVVVVVVDINTLTTYFCWLLSGSCNFTFPALLGIQDAILQHRIKRLLSVDFSLSDEESCYKNGRTRQNYKTNFFRLYCSSVHRQTSLQGNGRQVAVNMQ